MQYINIIKILACVSFPFIFSGIIMFLLSTSANNPFGQWIQFASNNFKHNMHTNYDYEKNLINAVYFIYNFIFPFVFFANGILSGALFNNHVVIRSLFLSSPAILTLFTLIFSNTQIVYIIFFVLLSGIGSLIPQFFLKQPTVTEKK